MAVLVIGTPEDQFWFCSTAPTFYHMTPGLVLHLLRLSFVTVQQVLLVPFEGPELHLQPILTGAEHVSGAGTIKTTKNVKESFFKC